MNHLCWHKPRLVILGSKVEALSDSHPLKSFCLLLLSRLFSKVGNLEGRKRVLIHGLGIWRERGNDYRVAETLTELSDANRVMGLYKEGIQQATEASEIFGRLGATRGQAFCLTSLARLLHQGKQLDAAEQVASRAMDLSENRNQFTLCQCHEVLGAVHQSRGNTEKTIHHFETSLQIASALNFRDRVFEGHLSLAGLYFQEGRFDEACTHVEHAKLHTGNSMLLLGRAFTISACALFGHNRFEEAKSEALRALAVLEKLGIANMVEANRQLLDEIQKKI